MANTQALSTNFLLDMFSGVHNLTTDTIKAALYKKTASLGASTAFYTPTGEVTGLNYVAGGVVVATAVAPAKAGLIVYWTPSASIQYPNVTISSPFNAVLLYNASKANRALGVFVFLEATISSDTFILEMPANTSTKALIRSKQVV